MKKLWSILLSVCMLISLAVPAAAAEQTSATASTLRLESVEGTAKMKDASGREVKTSKGTRMYSGYGLETQQKSYAYVSLDSSKAIKLDASTSTEVSQSGKKLELKVVSGRMFFNVTEPLKADEELNIRTSTMVTGVRGTCGWVGVVDRYTTQVSLLEGELTITSTDPLTGNTRSVTIVGGQTATVVHHGEGKDFESEITVGGVTVSTGTGTSSLIGDNEQETIENLIGAGIIQEEHIIEALKAPGLTVETLQEERVPGFVATEVAKDPVLQQTIEEKTQLSVPEIIGLKPSDDGFYVMPDGTATGIPVDGFEEFVAGQDGGQVQELFQQAAEEQVAEEEAAAEEEAEAIEKASEELRADAVVDPLFEPEEEKGETPSSGSSGGGATVPEAVTYTLTTSWVTEDGTELEATQSLTVNENDTYTAEEKSFDGYILLRTEGDAVTGTMDGNKTVTFVYDSLAQIELDNPTTAEVMAALDNGYGIINIANATEANLDLGAAIANSTNGLADGVRMNVTSGTLAAGANSPFTVDGTLNIEGTTVMNNEADITVNGTMNVSDTATLNNTGTITVNSTNSLHVNAGAAMDNTGEIIVGDTAAGAMTVDGTVTNSGTLRITEIGELTVAGTITSAGNGTYNTVTVENRGRTTVTGTVEYTGNDGDAIYAVGGEVIVDGGTVTGTQSGIDTNLISGYNGAITVNSGTVSGGSYGIKSDSGGTVTITGGEVSGGVAVYGTRTINMNGGAVTGATCGIQNVNGTLTISGGTVAVTGAQGDVIEGDFTYTGGALEAPNNAMFESLEATVAIPQATYDTKTGTYVLDLAGDPSVRTFATAEEASANLARTAGLSVDGGATCYVTEINLEAGATLTEDVTLMEDQILNVNGGNLVIPAGYTLGGGTVNVADGAVVENAGDLAVTTAMELTDAARLVNTGSVNVDGGELSVTGSGTEAIPNLDNQAGASMTIAGGTLTTASGSWVSNGGLIETDAGSTITLDGGLTNIGYTDVFGEIYVSGTMTTGSGSVINNLGVINGTTGSALALGGDLNNSYNDEEQVYGYVNVYGTITSETTSAINNLGGYFTVANADSADSAATAAASSVLNGNFVNAADSGAVPGSLYLGENGDVPTFGGLTFAGTLDNLGEIFVGGGSVVDATGAVNNNTDVDNSVSGGIWLYGYYDADQNLNYPGQLNMKGSSAELNNDAEIWVDDGGLNIYGGTLNNLERVYDDQGEAISGGYIYVGGTQGELNIYEAAEMINRGELEVNVPESAHVYGDLDNYGRIDLLSSYGRLVVEEGGWLRNYSDAVIYLSKGRLFVLGTVDNFYGATIQNGENNGGLISVMGTLNNSGTLINEYDGELTVGDWVDWAAERPTDFREGTLNNSGLLENRTGATLYISPASVLQNHQSLYNSGTIELGTADDTWMGAALTDPASMEPARLINGDEQTGPENTSNTFRNGYAMVGVDESLNELIEESTGTLNLYSGQLMNYSTMQNASDYAGDGTTGGTIIGYVTDENGGTTTSDATLVNSGVFENYNSNFNPGLGVVRFSNLGTYADMTGRDDAYLMVLDGNDPDAIVMEYYLGTMMNDVAWFDNCIWRLLPARGAEEAELSVDWIVSCDAANATLDLNGVTVVLEGEESFVIDSYIENGVLQYAGSLTLTDTSANGKGALTSGMADATIVINAGATLIHEGGTIGNTYGDDMGIPDGNCRVFGYEGDDANGIPAGAYTGSAADMTDVSLNNPEP